MSTLPLPAAARRPSGMTLVEVMVAMTIAVLTIGLALSTFLFGLRTMYKDTQRLATNANLRSFTTQVAKETLDATEFYVFPNYQSLDGSVDLAADPSPLQTDAYGTFLAYGDCLVLVTRVTTASSSNVRQIRIYYRTTADPNQTAPIRYYEGNDYGASGTATTLQTLLNAIDLNGHPTLSGSREIVQRARGRLIAGSTTDCRPIFSTEAPTASPANECVSLNVEIINGSSVNNLLSSSSFNYTISPRK